MTTGVWIVRGPPGVGKSTLALLLRERLAPAIRLGVDTLRYLAHPRTFDPLALRAAELGAVDLALRYVATGYSAILDSVYPDLVDLEEIRLRLWARRVPLRVVTLRASLETCMHRGLAREPMDRTEPARIREVLDSFVWDVGEVVNVDERLPEEVVDHLCSLAPPKVLTRATGSSLLFVRHGQAATPRDRYPDHAMMGLSLAGVAAAQAARPAVAGFGPGIVFCSPFPRAIETARLLAPDREIVIREELAERVFPEFYGIQWDEIAQRHGHELCDRLRHAPDTLERPGVPALDWWRDRLMRCSEELRHAHDRVLVVAHGGPHSWLIAEILGVPLSHHRRVSLDKCKGSLLRWASSPQLVALNIPLDQPWEYA